MSVYVVGWSVVLLLFINVLLCRYGN